MTEDQIKEVMVMIQQYAEFRCLHIALGQIEMESAIESKLREFSDWQPIETAPKDGTAILLWEEYSTNPFVGYWCKYARDWTVCLEHVDAHGGWNGAIAVSDIQCKVVFWKPVFAPSTPHYSN